MKNSEIRTRAKNFAIRVLEICEHIDTKNGRSVMVNQIVRSSTSIGANAHEANYASSKADFISKLQIALRECYETEYWIDMLHSSKCISDTDNKDLLNDCGIIRRMLVKSINTVKTNIAAERNR